MATASSGVTASQGEEKRTAAGGGWVALRHGEDREQLSARLRDAHRRFLGGDAAADGVRRVILESWQRSRLSGVDPDGPGGAPSLEGRGLHEYRAAHPMSVVLPVVRRLLVEDAADSGLLVAISDAEGRLLWVEGNHEVRRTAEEMLFVEGAEWSEGRVGTNAPGTALALDHCVQIYGIEHFSRPVQQFSCSAAPVHDPLTQQVLGAIDITGGPRVAAPEMLTLVRATVAAAEAELRLHAAGPLVRSRERTLTVLGTGRPVLCRDGTEVALSPRHAEILLLLSEHTEGLGTERLAMLLDERFLDAVTVRAEMSRLRRVLGAEVVGSRPYRLLQPVDTDVAAVRGLLARGEVSEALRAYPGAVLPGSYAPGVVDIRDELTAELRSALLQRANPALLARWVRSVEGRDDAIAWQAYLRLLPPSSPTYAQARAHVEQLDRRLGASATSLQRRRS